ncbi:amino acid adenylation domain-containing protein [Microbulbifer sp. ANSA003]|uniref:amino acid adenylation domain-containing protein n=1 Tax=Microbulbifer sp. ANSA003 TaxID=3243360 RepID=UPI0040431F5C
METLVEILRENSSFTPEKKAYIYLKNGEEESDSLTYQNLLELAEQMAGQILERSQVGDRVLLLMPPGLDYIKSFFACLFAGVIAVPAYPPHSAKHSFSRITSILKDCQPSLLITCADLADKFATPIFQPIEEEFGCQVEYVSNLTQPSDKQLPEIDPQGIAFLQYTSGSTGDPKGVMVTHHNLVENEKLIHQAFAHTSDSIIVGWLPLFHDMGLIGNLLQPLFVGATAILMPPQAFIQKPVRWLNAIAHYKANSSGGPNFAYRLCVDKIRPEEVQDLDLSHWRLAFNGSEKVQANTLRDFTHLLSNTGFSEQALFPCYGMAEATLYVSGMKTQPNYYMAEIGALAENQFKPAPQGLELVGSGVPEPGMRIAIVEPEQHVRLADGGIGEIWLQHASVAKGYWQKPELTREYFAAQLTGEQGNWLRTGDLGFMLGDELVVTGRRKEMLIICGRNYYPQDIEETVRQASELCQQDATASFAVDGAGQEQLVVVQEVKRSALRGLNSEELSAKIRKAVALEHQLEVTEVVLIKPASILKTTSGKIRRLALKQAYLANELKRVSSLKSPDKKAAGKLNNSAEVAALIEKLQEFTGPEVVLGADTEIFSIAQNSLKMIQLQHFIEEQLATEISLSALLECEHLAQLAALLGGAKQNQQKTDPGLAQASDALPTALQYLCFEQLKDPQSNKYNLAMALELHSGPDAGQLASVVGEQLQRLPLLSTRFREQAGQIESFIQEDVQAFFAHPECTPEQAQQALTTLVQTPLDLSCSQLYQVHYWPHSGGGASLLVLIHHAIADATSLQYLALELLGEPASSAPAFSEFSARACVAAVNTGGTPSQDEHQQPLKLSREIGENGQGSGVHFFNLNASLKTQLEQVARANKTTLNHVLQLAFSIGLSRYSEASLIHLINPVTVRGQRYLSSIGYFVNPVIVTFSPSADMSFSQLLKASREHFFSRLEQATNQSGRRPGEHKGQALFTFLESSENIDGRLLLGDANVAGDYNGHRINSIALPVTDLISELDIYIAQGEALAGKLVFDRALWSQQDAGQFISDFISILGFAAESSDRPSWRWFEQPDTAPDAAEKQPFKGPDLLAQIAHQVQVQPDAPALRDLHGNELSYAGLWQFSGELANRLKNEYRLGWQDSVAIYMDAGVCRVIAMLAVLRVGANYVPVDKNYPQGRCRDILSVAKPQLALVDSCSEALPVRQCPLSLDVFGCTSSELAAVELPPERLAYTIFTSGSTGRPKGVAVSYLGINQLLAWAQTRYSREDCAQVLASTSICFDISVFELFIPLAMGGQVALIGSILELPGLPDKEKLTLVNSVPSAVSAALEAALLPKSLRVVNLAGEALSRQLVKRLKAELPCRVFNLYGPSEDTVYSTCQEVAGNDKPLIGRELTGSQGYILDAWLNPVPEGAVGELYLSGPGVCRGYMSQPELTASAFLPDPFASIPGQRMYRTGDLVRRQRDGSLEYIGRKDQQIKLRGQRIELEEIESQLCLLEDIHEAVVSVHQEQLVAYVVTRSETMRSGQLKQHLAEHLPAYMVPSLFVELAQIPRLANGKTDRSSLPQVNLSQEFSAPEGELENALAAIWQQELSLEQIGRNDDLFTLGAHSLSVLKVKYQISEQFGADLEIADLIELRTVSELAALIQSKNEVKELLIEIGQQDEDDQELEEFVL